MSSIDVSLFRPSFVERFYDGEFFISDTPVPVRVQRITGRSPFSCIRTDRPNDIPARALS